MQPTTADPINIPRSMFRGFIAGLLFPVCVGLIALPFHSALIVSVAVFLAIPLPVVLCTAAAARDFARAPSLYGLGLVLLGMGLGFIAGWIGTVIAYATVAAIKNGLG